MPAIAPMPLKSIDENERNPAPHRLGIMLPTVEPTNAPIQTKGRELFIRFCAPKNNGFTVFLAFIFLFFFIVLFFVDSGGLFGKEFGE